MKGGRMMFSSCYCHDIERMSLNEQWAMNNEQWKDGRMDSGEECMGYQWVWLLPFNGYNNKIVGT